MLSVNLGVAMSSVKLVLVLCSLLVLALTCFSHCLVICSDGHGCDLYSSLGHLGLDSHRRPLADSVILFLEKSAWSSCVLLFTPNSFPPDHFAALLVQDAFYMPCLLS